MAKPAQGPRDLGVPSQAVATHRRHDQPMSSLKGRGAPVVFTRWPGTSTLPSSCTLNPCSASFSATLFRPARSGEGAMSPASPYSLNQGSPWSAYVFAEIGVVGAGRPVI